MARIRSVHPSLFSDEAFVSCSPYARLLVIGLWTDADDKGVFEWKPLTIKMRIFPADAFDIAAMSGFLEELVEANILRRFEIEGKEFGAIRNFRKFQRPKKPNSIHPIPDELLLYVGLSDASSEPVGNQFGTGSEISPQREDGGWRVEDGRGKKKEDVPADAGSPPSNYAFEAGTIKLVEKDLTQWRNSFPSLRLEAELLALDDWAGREKASGKNWFRAVSNALAKKEREAFERIQMRKLEISTPKPPPRQHIDGRI